MTLAIHGVDLSHPEKVLYPEQGVTKFFSTINASLTSFCHG